MIHKINDSIYRIELPLSDTGGEHSVNCYLLMPELLLVDAGPADSAAYKVLEDALRSINVSINQLNAVIITHHHSDHTGLLTTLPDSIPIYMNSTSIQYFCNSSAIQDKEFITKTIAESVDVPEPKRAKLMEQLFRDYRLNGLEHKTLHLMDQEGWLFDKYKIILLKGHSCNDLCIYCENYNIVISGDLLLDKVTINSLLEINPSDGTLVTNLMRRYMSSVEFIRTTNAVLLPGHGEIIYDAASLINNNRLKTEKRLKKAQRIIKQYENLSVNSLCEKLFPGLCDLEYYLALSETFNILDLLDEQKSVKIDNSKQGAPI
ncbi:MBL fold metallo-hydrolase [Paenibacillus agri]|uniref:MBL fold metallo-hydrolase n=1 Tax=Paenibacillus agri TaxID=2744309 RepID=A0A850ELH4_9BACL|nr:MBL fold metallo-hydrolase [Paenibacillus agri]NUU60579.1 MBL fold metallo-hydrolase [Paenibacillus agri]